MSIRRVLVVVVSLIFLFSTFTVPQVVNAADKPFLHPLFTDHMVMQRDALDPV
ncbi:MAG TPA: hypothetical protein VIO64_03715 [Pseudobacteroides sp.]|uniref:hypothetical protein n=1 Tax=Pseudobacteroides sp. TaxID=1968840 RepID=UPI002F95812A